MSGSREATMACPMDSILEDISPEVAKINVPTVLLAGELDQVDSIERHKTEVLAYLQNAQLKIIWEALGSQSSRDESCGLRLLSISLGGGFTGQRSWV
jgi:hypothetical protein